jgi:hypothetical protein
MNFTNVLAAIDKEIGRLRSARALLASDTPAIPSKSAKVPAKQLVKRTMSAEGRARVAAAQKKRWAKLKKASR